MKFALIFAVVLIAAVASVTATGCEVDGLTIAKGESKAAPVGKCMSYKCEDNNSITGKACGVFQPSKGCKASDYDNTKPFPECCPKEVC